MTKEEEKIPTNTQFVTREIEDEIVDDEPNAHSSHRRIMRYRRSPQRFNNSMKGNK